jgi:hypothetical protein
MSKQLIIIIVFVFIQLFSIAQDTIPNQGFENWDFFGNYEDPTGWGTLNSVTSFLNAATVKKATVSSDVHSGNAALRMETLQTSVQIIPAVVTTGVINTATQTIDGGAAFTARPTSFKGWYKYQPVNNDTGSVEILLYKWNTGTNNRDIIGRGKFEQTATVSSYQQFNITINYLSADIPDTAVVTLLSSPNSNPQVGSLLFIDDLSFEYNTGINIKNKNEEMAFSISPNPVSNNFNITIKNAAEKNMNIDVYQMDGKLITQLTTKGKKNILLRADDFNLLPGVYLLKLSDGLNSSIRKLVKN